MADLVSAWLLGVVVGLIAGGALGLFEIQVYRRCDRCMRRLRSWRTDE